MLPVIVFFFYTVTEQEWWRKRRSFVLFECIQNSLRRNSPTKSYLDVKTFTFKRARCLVNEYLTFHVPRTTLGTWRGGCAFYYNGQTTFRFTWCVLTRERVTKDGSNAARIRSKIKPNHSVHTRISYCSNCSDTWDILPSVVKVHSCRATLLQRDTFIGLCILRCENPSDSRRSSWLHHPFK